MTNGSGSDRNRLSDDYERILSDEYRSRWSLENPGNRELSTERLAVMSSLIEGQIPDRDLLILDLGCGTLSVLPSGLRIDSLIGVDLLFERLTALKVQRPTFPAVNADGARLPFANSTFDVVVMSVMMSSVLDRSVRRLISGEVDRVLRRDGVVLWYDFRTPNPLNKATRGVAKRELRQLFPEHDGPSSTLTLLPPIARRLGGRAPSLYPVLARIPALRSHRAACLRRKSP